MTNRNQRSTGIQRIDLAYAVLASSEIARDINRDVVLELVRTKQPVSRADLARRSGLQPSTISSIVEQLRNEGWITEGAVARRPRGRHPTLLSLNGNLAIAVADIRPTRASVAVVDLNGRCLFQETVPLVKDPQRGVEKLIEVLQRMIEEHPEKSFEGIGLSLPGRVDSLSERLIFAPNLPWAKYDIKGAIERRIPLRVEMDNAANACLLSELWFGRMEGVRNAVLITISEGVGSAILANGQLVTGKSGLAGEFGHVCIDPKGPRCGCGGYGCWEIYASSRAAIGFYSEMTPDATQPTIMELMTLAEDGDEAAYEALSRQAMYLGQGLRTVVAALAPEMILVSGGLAASWARFGPIAEAQLADKMLAGPPPRIVAISDTELARLRGAAILVLQRHSGKSLPSRPGAKGRQKPPRKSKPPQKSKRKARG